MIIIIPVIGNNNFKIGWSVPSIRPFWYCLNCTPLSPIVCAHLQGPWIKARLELTLLWYKPHCFSHVNHVVVMPTSIYLHKIIKKSIEVCIKARSTPAWLLFKDLVTGLLKTKTLGPRKRRMLPKTPNLANPRPIFIWREMKMSGHTWSVVTQLNMADYPAFTLKQVVANKGLEVRLRCLVHFL